MAIATVQEGTISVSDPSCAIYSISGFKDDDSIKSRALTRDVFSRQ